MSVFEQMISLCDDIVADDNRPQLFNDNVKAMYKTKALLKQVEYVTSFLFLYPK